MFQPIARLLLSGALLGIPAFVQAVDLPDTGPWSDAWTMDIKGSERIFVVHKGKDYLWSAASDFVKPKGLAGMDVAHLGKFSRRQGDSPVFYGLESVLIASDDPLIAAAGDGENYYLFGSISEDGDPLTYTVTTVVKAPTDGQVLNGKLEALPADAYEKRLELADWARKHADSQGNKTWWLETSASIRVKTIKAAGALAAEKKNIALLLQAMDWAIQHVDSRAVAAELASADWVFSLPGEDLDKVSSVMKELDYILFEFGGNRQWLTKSDFLTKTYETRFAAIKWGDAESFYQLGLWAEEHGDILPRSSQLSHKAFQAGHRMDPKHNGIRRMLKMELVAEGSDNRTQDGVKVDLPFLSANGTVELTGQTGWNRNDPPVISDADASWTTRAMPTTYMAISTRQFAEPRDQIDHWSDLRASIGALTGVQIAEGETTETDAITTQTLSFTFTMNGNPRRGTASLIYHREYRVAAALRVVYEDDNQPNSIAAFEERRREITFHQSAQAEDSAE